MTGGASARRKGITFEQALARHLHTVTTRSVAPGVHDDIGDVIVPGWVIEAKNHKRWTVAFWFADTELKAEPLGRRPALILKRPRLPIEDALVVVRLRDVQ